MPYSRLPLCSSDKLTAALRRLGCYEGEAKPGTHRLYYREVNNNIEQAPVILGKREIPRGTLTNILKLLHINEGSFRSAVRS